MTVEIDKNLAYDIVAEGIRNPPTTERGLYEFIVALTGEFIPFEPCCKEEGHVSPWDFIWRVYRGDLPQYQKSAKRNIVYIGSRAGYKTLSVAKVIAAELLLKPNCDVACMGAIEMHSKRIYQFVQKYLKHPAVIDAQMIQKFMMEETTLFNGSRYKQAIATMAGANALHPQKLFLDEVDLMKQDVVDEVRMAASSHLGIDARMVFVSTRKFEGGIMDVLADHASARDYDVLISCYKDTAETCPDARSGIVPTQYVVQDLYKAGQSNAIEALDGCGSCSLLPSCRGDLKRSKGVIRIDDIINDFNTLPREKWIWQKECGKTRSSDLYFQYWNEAKQAGRYPYNEKIGWVDMSFDFTGGGDDPTVVGFWQTDEFDNDYLIKEMQWNKKLVKDVADDIIAFVLKNNWRVRLQLGDSAAMQWISELNAYDPNHFRIRPTKKIMNKDAWPLMRNRICDNNGIHHVFVNRTECPLFMAEIGNCKKSVVDPLEIKKGQSDHSLDQAKYRFVEFRWLGEGGMPNIRMLTNPSVEARQRAKAQDGSKPLEAVEPKNVWDYLPRYLFGDDD